MQKHIINIDALPYKSFPGTIPEHAKEKFEGATLAQAGQQVGAQKLGYNVTLLPPGKRAFPFHNHHVNEEMFFMLEGEGEVRIGNETFPVRKGDFLCCPPGGPELAHQIINTSEAELKYLSVSTRISPELVDYPDSKKFGVMADVGTQEKPSIFRFLGRAEESMGY